MGFFRFCCQKTGAQRFQEQGSDAQSMVSIFLRCAALRLLKKISWNGAFIGNVENADLPLNIKGEGIHEEDSIELAIKYQNGNYWLVTSKQNNADVYSKLHKNDLYVLQPDDIINMGDLDFLIQRFNCGVHCDKGSRNHMEDYIVIRQQLGVSLRLNVSFFAVFDG